MADPTASAVSFAAALIRKGEDVGAAINVAAGYYRVPRADVQRGLAARSGRSQAGRPKRPRPPRACINCQSAAAEWRGTLRWGFDTQAIFSCAACGKVIPDRYEVGRGFDGVRWTRYRPTATTDGAS